MNSGIGRWILAALVFAQLSCSFSSKAETLNFDTFSPGHDSAPIPNGYGNLRWENFGVYCGLCRSTSEGYHRATVSPTNVAFNLYGDPASIASEHPFNLQSAHLTAALNLDGPLEIRVQGFLGTNLVHDNIYTVNREAPSFITFNYVGVDRVKFTSFPAIQFAVDDLTVIFANACDSSLFPGGRMHGFGAETGSVTVVTATGCPWSVSNTNSWLTVQSTLNNSNSGTVTYTLEANPSPLPRSGLFEIAGQSFSVRQSGTSTPPVFIGPVEVPTIGHSINNPVPLPTSISNPPAHQFFLIDQDQSSGGGGMLPTLPIDWDIHTQFALKISAPAGMKFLVQVPAGHAVGFGGFLWWESTRGGQSPAGQVAAAFEGLEGTPPEFSRSDSVLSTSHGFFGFLDLEGTTVTNDFSFTSITLTGTVIPQYTGNGSEVYIPHRESSLHLIFQGPGITNGAPHVSIVPVASPPTIHVTAFSPIAGATLALKAASGRSHVVDCSEDLIHWRAISTNLGAGSLLDPGCTNVPKRFYRIRPR